MWWTNVLSIISYRFPRIKKYTITTKHVLLIYTFVAYSKLFCVFSAYCLKGTTSVFYIISVFMITFGVSISTICKRFHFMVWHDSRWDEFWTSVCSDRDFCLPLFMLKKSYKYFHSFKNFDMFNIYWYEISTLSISHIPLFTIINNPR